MDAQSSVRPAQHSDCHQPRSRCGTSRTWRSRSKPDAGICPAARPAGRETIVTSPIEATPQYLLRLPGPGWPPFFAAVLTAVFFLLLTVKAVTLALVCGARRDCDDPGVDVEQRSETHRGGGHRRRHQAADLCVRPTVAFLVGDGRSAAGGGLAVSRLVFSYLYLWTVSPQVWPKPDALPAADVAHAVGSAACRKRRAPRWRPRARSAHAKRIAARFRGADRMRCRGAVGGIRRRDLCTLEQRSAPHTDAHAAIVAMASFLQAQLVLPVVIWACFVVARLFAGHLDRRGALPLKHAAAVALCRRPGTIRADAGTRLSERSHVTTKAAAVQRLLAGFGGPHHLGRAFLCRLRHGSDNLR